VRLLVRIPNWFGDVVMATAALRTLRRGLPSAHISLVGKSHLVPILEGSGWHDETIVLPAGAGPIAFGRSLRGRGFSHAILLTHSWSSAIMAWAARVPVRIGHANEGRGVLLTHAAPLRRTGRIRPEPAPEAYLRLCRLAGCETAEEDLRVELPVDAAAAERAGAWLAERGVGPDEAPVAMNVGAGFGVAKQWPAERWARVADRVTATGRPVVVYGGPKDEAAVEAVLAASRGGRVLRGLGVPITDLAAHMRRAALLISTDSGGRHFGVAVGTPTIVLMGPNHPNLTECDANADGYVVVLTRPACWPCHLRVCPIDHRCMVDIDAERIARMALGWIDGAHPFGGARPWRTPPGAEHEHFAGACC
jgi:heptosyltransferase-2